MTMSLFASQIVAELTSMETTPCLFVKKEEEFVDFGTVNDISLLFTLYKFYKERRIVERNVLLLNSLMKEYQTKQQVNLNNLIALYMKLRKE